MELRMVSQAMVRPEESTDGGTLFLSNIDQLLMLYVETVYVCQPPHAALRPGSGGAAGGRSDVVNVLKGALAKVLVPYHFMAGRLRMNEEEERLEVWHPTKEAAAAAAEEAASDGVLFYHVEAQGSVAELGGLHATNPLLAALTPHPQPISRDHSNLPESPLLIIQVTTFTCGGFAIGLAFMHALLDGVSAATFFGQYASIARGDGLKVYPCIDKEALRARSPPQVTHSHPHIVQGQLSDPLILGLPNLHITPLEKQWISFNFSLKMINSLREQCVKEARGRLTNCTSFETLAAYVWRARTQSLAMDPKEVYPLKFNVDFRKKFNPPLPDELMGNAIVAQCVRMCVSEIVESPLWQCVEAIQRAKGKVTEEFVRSELDYLQLNKGSSLCLEGINVSTWSRLSVMNLDFGWGEPEYAGPIAHVGFFKDVAIFLPLKKRLHEDEGGVEMCVALHEHEMKFREIFQNTLQI